jgi:hypothetical protein
MDDPTDNPVVVGTMSAGLEAAAKSPPTDRHQARIRLPWSNTPASAGNESWVANVMNNLIGFRP